MAFVPALVVAGAAGAAGAGYAAYRWLYGRYVERKYKEECQRLLLEIKEKLRKENSTFRFLLFGITQHGKSTLCNGILSAYKGRENVADFFQGGSSGNTFTKGFCPCKLAGNLWLIDMGGIFESNLIDVENIKQILEGKVPFYEKLGEYLQRLDPDLQFPEAESNDLTCVVVTTKPDIEITAQLRDKFRAVDDCAARGRISRCLVVTHIEEIDTQFEEPRNLINIENSRRIKNYRQRISEETGIPLTAITFVRNYWDRRKTDVYTNYILLKFFDQLMQSGIDAKKRVADGDEIRNMH